MAPHGFAAPAPTATVTSQYGVDVVKPGENVLEGDVGNKPHLSEIPIKPMVYMAGCMAAIGGLIFGYDVGGSGGTFNMAGFRRHFGWPIKENSTDADSSKIADEQGWITAVFALGAAAGALPAGYLTDRLGRKKTLLFYGVIFIIGALVQMVAPDLGALYAGRFIGGLGVGGLSMVATMYQSEIAPEAIRGRLVTLQQLSITFGIFLAAALNVGLQYYEEGWRFSYGGNGFLAAALVLMVLFFPESPRWLVKQGRIEDARRALHRLRFEHEVEPELDLIIEEERAQALMKKGTWADLFRAKRNMNYITMVGVAILFFQQLTGINAIMYFAPVIFGTFMKNGTALYANLGIMFVNFIATFIAIALVDRAGRRTLLVWGSLGMVLTTVVVCVMSGVLPYKTDVAVGAVIVVFCALYVINFSYSWGPIGWVVPAEIFPMDLRDKGMALTTMGNWLSNFAIGKVTPILIRPANFNLWGTFLFFGCWCAIMGVFVLVFVPETKGTALELVDRLFTSFREIPVAQRLVRINMKSKLAFLHTAAGEPAVIAGEALPAKNPERSRDNTLETSPLPPV